MPLRLNVGVSRKLGLPNYGSIGASCAVEVELESLIFHDMETLQGRIQESFDACHRSVDEELGKYEAGELPTRLTSTSEDRTAPVAMCPGESAHGSEPLATCRQVDFA